MPIIKYFKLQRKMDPSQNHFIKFASLNSKYGKDRTNTDLFHI